MKGTSLASEHTEKILTYLSLHNTKLPLDFNPHVLITTDIDLSWTVHQSRKQDEQNFLFAHHQDVSATCIKCI